MPAAHAVHADAPDTSLNLPAGQVVQDALPAAELKFPGAQGMHAEELVLHSAELKVPGRQSTHAEGVEEPWFGL